MLGVGGVSRCFGDCVRVCVIARCMRSDERMYGREYGSMSARVCEREYGRKLERVCERKRGACERVFAMRELKGCE